MRTCALCDGEPSHSRAKQAMRYGCSCGNEILIRPALEGAESWLEKSWEAMNLGRAMVKKALPKLPN